MQPIKMQVRRSGGQTHAANQHPVCRDSKVLVFSNKTFVPVAVEVPMSRTQSVWKVSKSAAVYFSPSDKLLHDCAETNVGTITVDEDNVRVNAGNTSDLHPSSTDFTPLLVLERWWVFVFESLSIYRKMTLTAPVSSVGEASDLNPDKEHSHRL